ncbi:MAG: hypothetical protein V7K57_13165 [Nostoc sp.]
MDSRISGEQCIGEPVRVKSSTAGWFPSAVNLYWLWRFQDLFTYSQLLELI